MGKVKHKIIDWLTTIGVILFLLFIVGLALLGLLWPILKVLAVFKYLLS